MDVCVPLFCVCIVLCVDMGLATGWSPSKESYCLCKKITKLKKRPGPNKGPVEPLVNEWMNEETFVEECTRYEAPHYAVFSILRSLLLLDANIPLRTCTQAHFG
jgi:hypothetical protein